jgi:hypothetical protein
MRFRILQFILESVYRWSNEKQSEVEWSEVKQSFFSDRTEELYLRTLERLTDFNILRLKIRGSFGTIDVEEGGR